MFLLPTFTQPPAPIRARDEEERPRNWRVVWPRAYFLVNLGRSVRTGDQTPLDAMYTGTILLPAFSLAFFCNERLNLSRPSQLSYTLHTGCLCMGWVTQKSWIKGGGCAIQLNHPTQPLCAVYPYGQKLSSWYLIRNACCNNKELQSRN